MSINLVNNSSSSCQSDLTSQSAVAVVAGPAQATEEIFALTQVDLERLQQPQQRLVFDVIGSAPLRRYYKDGGAITDLIQACKTVSQSGELTIRDETIEDFTHSFFTTLDPCMRSGKNERLFGTHITATLLNHLGTVEEKETIIFNLLADYSSMMNEAKMRCLKDVENGSLLPLGIPQGTKISAIQVLSCDTHDHGRVPLLIAFENGQKIIYKPRSMHPELTLYKTGGLLEQAGLGTYTIVAKTGYGYCACLENNEQENTFSDLGELQTYHDHLRHLNTIAKQLGITDLHLGNIITSRKIPYMIDAECFLDARKVPTGVFEPLGGGNCFCKDRNAFVLQYEKNRVWIDPFVIEFLLGDDEDEDPATMIANFRYGLQAPDLKTLGIQDVEKEYPLPVEEQDRLATTARELSQEPGRIVLLSTVDLRALLNLSLSDTASVEAFQLRVIDALMQSGFTEQINLGAIRKGIEDNVLHQDLPIFSYNSRTGEILYNNLVIAQRQK